MKRLIYFLLSLSALTILVSCCLGTDDNPIDNTIVISIYNLNKTDNLLDDEGDIVFMSKVLSRTESSEIIQRLERTEQDQFVFWPILEVSDSESIVELELSIDLDSLSYPLTLSFSSEEIRCAGTQFRITSYNFNGEDFDFDSSLLDNNVELFLDL